MAHYSASQPLPRLHAPRISVPRASTHPQHTHSSRPPPKKYFIVFDVLFLFVVLMFYCIDLAGFAGPVVCVPCLTVQCGAGVSGSGYIPWHVNIYRHLSTYPPSHASSTHRPIHPYIPVYLHPSITCGLVMCTARDGPIIRHLSRSASPPLFFIPTNASAYAHRYRGICKKRKMYTERYVSIERQIQGHVFACTVFMWECAYSLIW